MRFNIKCVVSMGQQLSFLHWFPLYFSSESVNFFLLLSKNDHFISWKKYIFPATPTFLANSKIPFFNSIEHSTVYFICDDFDSVSTTFKSCCGLKIFTVFEYNKSTTETLSNPSKLEVFLNSHLEDSRNILMWFLQYFTNCKFPQNYLLNFDIGLCGWILDTFFSLSCLTNRFERRSIVFWVKGAYKFLKLLANTPVVAVCYY